MHEVPLLDGIVGVIQEDQKVIKKSYVESLKLKKVRIVGMNVVGVTLVAKPLEETR